MIKSELAKKIYAAAYLTGDFLLRSGQRSTEYFDKFMFNSDPKILAEIAEGMSELIPQETDVIAGLEMGAIPVVTALSIETGRKCAFVRKTAKEYGTCKLAEGMAIDGKKVCVIEDVVTTGGQQLASVKELRARGAEIDTVLCVILRNEAAHEAFTAEGLTLVPLFTMDYIKKETAKLS